MHMPLDTCVSSIVMLLARECKWEQAAWPGATWCRACQQQPDPSRNKRCDVSQNSKTLAQIGYSVSVCLR